MFHLNPCKRRTLQNIYKRAYTTTNIDPSGMLEFFYFDLANIDIPKDMNDMKNCSNKTKSHSIIYLPENNDTIQIIIIKITIIRIR